MFNCMVSKTVIVHITLWLIMTVNLFSSQYAWNSTEEWSACSVKCGEGYEQQVHVCMKKTPYGTNELAPSDTKCSKTKMTINKRKCTLGSCPTALNDSFVWVVSNWTQCSKQCGGLALQSREVACFLMTHSGQLLVSKLNKCDLKIEPNRFIGCGKIDCPPKFLTSKWGKCPNSINCGRAIRRRKVECVSFLKDGKHKIIPSAFCYRMGLRPPGAWVICTPDNDRSCTNASDINRLNMLEVKIDKDESEIFQMRSSKRMRLLIGQTASIFTNTKLSIVCRTEDFPPSLIRWSHDGRIFTAKDEPTDRVRVNQRGILIIKRFMLNDTGVWTCHAGRSSANISLKHELPSNGFRNWLQRHSNQNYGMFNEESKGPFIRPDSLVWMKSVWSKCSISCGKDDDEIGFQVRKVTCEKVEAKYYKIIDDKYCTSNRPISKRRCKSTVTCPIWRIEEELGEQCTDNCINVDLANKNTKIYCEYESRAVDTAFCDSSTKPNTTCQNTKCKPQFAYGAWSQCSLSCSNRTSVSIRSRTMQCVWQHNGRSAFDICQHYNILHEPLTKSCSVPKCILGCRDLSPVCQRQSKYRCRSSLFNHLCCAFCRRRNIY